MRRRTDNPNLCSKYPLELTDMAEERPTRDRVIDSRPATLEDEIDILRGLDQQRRISADLRDYGVKVLEGWLKDGPGPLHGSSTRDKIGVERQILLAVAAVDVLYRCCRRPTEEIETLLKSEIEILLKSLVTYPLPREGGPEMSSAAPAAKGHVPPAPHSPFLRNLESHDLSVLLAAELMQMLAAAPDLSYSKETLLCYYWIVRELYTADAPEWNIGGARAGPGGRVSAFITSKCVLSIVRFAHAQEQTALFIDSLCSYEEQSRRLKANKEIPGPYKDVEMERLRFSCYVALHRYGKTLALPFKKPSSPDDIDGYTRNTLAELKNTVKGYDLRLMSVAAANGLVNDGRNLVIVALVGADLHIRIFDASGNKVVDKAEHELVSGGTLAALKNQLTPIPDESGLSNEYKQKIIGDATSIAGHPLAKSVSEMFGEAVADVDHFRKGELDNSNCGEENEKQQEKIRFERSTFAHERARSALKQGLLTTTDVCELFEHSHAPDPIEVLKKISSELHDAAVEVRKMLEPSQNFLSSVLDRELTAVSLGTDSTWVPHEMAFAAAFLGILGKRWRGDKRLLQAGQHLSRTMSDRGEFPFSRPFHSINEDPKLLYPAAVLRPFTELVRCVPDIPADLGIVRNMLRYFQETRMGQLGQDTDISDSTDGGHSWYKKHGWFDEDGLQPYSFMPGPTIAAVRALAAINRMLDERINHIVLRHFRIKTPDRDLKLDLDALFYPDYGLTMIPKEIGMPIQFDGITGEQIFDQSEWPRSLLPEESVAITLQRMRAHVTRVSIPKSAGDRPFSLVLHGPPGTGKTTLVEALAKSCGVAFVEVTPSDIVVGGEEEVERRASAVFKALTLLTRVVILFDEFDPVLWRRDPTGSTPRSVFTFLTPGMLPKLKDLHREAERRCCAYALVTNLIGGLDEAAVREGRFDRRLGVYPPDALSRTGRFLSQTDMFVTKATGLEKPSDLRVWKVVKNTSGGAMETLGKPEWMTAPDPREVA